jgi:hypothetical protein
VGAATGGGRTPADPVIIERLGQGHAGFELVVADLELFLASVGGDQLVPKSAALFGAEYGSGLDGRSVLGFAA